MILGVTKLGMGMSTLKFLDSSEISIILGYCPLQPENISDNFSDIF